MLSHLRPFWTVLLAAIMVFSPTAAYAQSADWNVDRSASAIRFSGTHAGRAFNGNFGQWTARIRFDPANLAQSRIIVVIETASAATGDRVQETTLRTGEWFDTGNHRTASFRSTSIASNGGDSYTARGVLEVKGREVPVTLPFTLDINGNRARASGRLTLDRTALNLGMASDPRAQFVSQNIQLVIDVTATRS